MAPAFAAMSQSVGDMVLKGLHDPGFEASDLKWPNMAAFTDAMN